MYAGFDLENNDKIWVTERVLLINIFFKKSLMHIFIEIERYSVQKPNGVVA